MTSGNKCEQVVHGYLEELDQEVVVEPIVDGCVIITPFLMPDGDYLEVTARFLPSGTVRLTDTGETISFLWLNGLSLSRTILQDVRRIARRYGTSLNRNQLVVDSDEGDNPLHRLIQAILGVASLIEKRRPYARLNFAEEVEAAIIAQGSNYDSPYQVSGKQESHTVRFHLNSDRHILAQPLSQASEPAARAVAERSYYLFDDILNQASNWKCFALVDDRGNRKAIWTEHALTPLRPVCTVVQWSEEKEDFLRVLAQMQ